MNQIDSMGPVDLKRGQAAWRQRHEHVEQGASATMKARRTFAFDLDDEEIRDHSRRIVRLAVRLGRAMSMTDDQLVHLRRGAFLHDLGMASVPDEILFKPGPLTEQEWAIVRRHPVFAYELLSSVRELIPALDIPYCHHERWDGSGYPRGLKGEEIPLAANYGKFRIEERRHIYCPRTSNSTARLALKNGW